MEPFDSNRFLKGALINGYSLLHDVFKRSRENSFGFIFGG